jgi:hypothetical protein
MSIEPTDAIDPNTDDLDAFSDLLNNKAREKIPESEVEEHQDEPEAEDEEEDQESEEDLDGDPEPEPKPKKVNRFQERINELTAKAKEAERALQELKTAQAKPSETPRQAAPKEEGPSPDMRNEDGSDKYPLGEFDPQYIRDLTRHTIQEEQKVAREQEANERGERQNAEARQQLQSSWVEKLNPVAEKYDDYLEKTLSLESAFDGLDPQYSDYLVQTIKSLDHGPEVLYYFANNLDAAKAIIRGGPLSATLALGKYNALFDGETRKEAKVSKAPPPPQVNKGTKGRVTVAGDTDDLDAFSRAFFRKK